MDNQLRECKGCGLSQPLSKYTKNGKIKGAQYYRHECTDCYTKAKRLRRDEARLWFVEYKKTLCCCKCGNDDYRVLEFDHRNPEEKERNVSDCVKRGWSKERLMTEIDKCDVMCANCHRIKTYDEYYGM